jgi:hypothetical protein
MSKTMRRLHRNPTSPLSHRPGQSYFPLTRRESIHMTNKHRRWPLGAPVFAATPVGVLRGTVMKHWRSTEYPHGCSVEFATVVDLGDANGARFGHVIPFRCLCKVRGL